MGNHRVLVNNAGIGQGSLLATSGAAARGSGGVVRRTDRLEEHRDNADRAELRELDMRTGANAAQQEYWNSVAGPRWVGLAGYVEKRVERVNDLLLARSAIKPGERVLEVGCGTGAATVPLAEAVGGTGEVVGIDISEPMLAGARERISQSGLRNITLLRADAQVHSFEPNRFDLIASRFGVMFFADPTAAFRNLLGAMRPAGRLCFACWAALEENRHWLIPYERSEEHTSELQSRQYLHSFPTRRSSDLHAVAGRRASSFLRAQPLRPDRVALWRDVLCRSDSRLPKPAWRDAARRAAVLCVLGGARGKSALADPLRKIGRAHV